MNGEKISDGWRLCEELTIKQAALLFAGCDPASSDGTFCEEWKPHERPAGYEGAKQSISSALRKGRITGINIEVTERDWNGNPVDQIPNTTDINASEVDRDSLVEWLRSKGVTTGFFFPDAAMTDTPGYLNPGHERFSAKLAAAVLVWLAMGDENLIGSKGLVPSMEDWLGSRYKELGLEWQGAINKSGISEAAKVANWKTGGGATKTPGG